MLIDSDILNPKYKFKRVENEQRIQSTSVFRSEAETNGHSSFKIELFKASNEEDSELRILKYTRKSKVWLYSPVFIGHLDGPHCLSIIFRWLKI